MKKILTFLLAMTLVFSLVACSGGSKPAEKTDGGNTASSDSADKGGGESSKNQDRPLIVASSDFSGDFYEGWTNSSYDKEIRRLVWGFGLMEDTVDGDLVDSPLVAEKTVSDDLLTWTFKIADGITFQTGEPLTASDVKFTYDFYLDSDALKEVGASSLMSDYIDNVEINEEQNTVTFNLKKAIYTVDASLFYEVWIFDEDRITKGAKEAGKTVQAYVKDHISEPVGYGPYELVEYKESEYVKLKAFDNYIGKKPAIKELIVKVTPQETQLDQIFQHQVDVLPVVGEGEKIDSALADDSLLSNSYFRHGGGTMVLHTDFGPLQLTEVRQAFAYAFNRPKVIELFLGQYGISSQGPYSKNHWMMYDDDEMDKLGTAANSRFEDSLTNYDILDANGNFDEEANINKAFELVSKAAARTDGEYAKLTGDKASGFKWDGQPLTINIAFTSFWSDTYNLVWNSEYVSRLPFDIKLYGMDWPVMYGHWTGDTTEERKYNAFVGGVSYVLKANPKADYSTKLILPWGQASTNQPRFLGGSKLTPEQWDELLEKIENANPLTGKEEYKKNWREFVKVFNEEMPIIPVYSNQYYDFYTSDLENFNTKALWPWSRAVLDANWK